FCGQLGCLFALHRDYCDRVNFLFVQIADAGHVLPEKVRSRYFEAGLESETADNRLPRARLAAEVMGAPFRCLLDNPGGDVCRRYSAFPQRLVVICGDRLRFDAGAGVLRPGEGGWDFAAIRARLDRLLAGYPVDPTHGRPPSR